MLSEPLMFDSIAWNLHDIIPYSIVYIAFHNTSSCNGFLLAFSKSIIHTRPETLLITLQIARRSYFLSGANAKENKYSDTSSQTVHHILIHDTYKVLFTPAWRNLLHINAIVWLRNVHTDGWSVNERIKYVNGIVCQVYGNANCVCVCA